MEVKEIKKIISLAQKSGIAMLKVGDLEFAFGPQAMKSVPIKSKKQIQSKESNGPSPTFNEVPTLEQIQNYIHNDDEVSA